MYRLKCLKTGKSLLVESSFESVEVLSLAGRYRDIAIPVSHSTWKEAVVVVLTGLFRGGYPFQLKAFSGAIARV